ncbi:MAG TPA: hypothetical protein VGV37_02475 [Aliidongia sp.]|uniref:hypothetical protein n=1 Tax=Aliidongia sp. TaxID=1914230 RepID=UPI002DDCDCCD|nr:hypothetical protein [Aliidongia sp.]HEV2673376.1 hypothetical protein [Aliidongia sp.]
MTGDTPELDQPPAQPLPAPGDDQLRQQFTASRAVAGRPNDQWIRELAAGPQPASGSGATPASAPAPGVDGAAAAPAPVAAPDTANVPISQRILSNLGQVGRGMAEDAMGGYGAVAFLGRLRDAAGAGASQALKDLTSAGDALAQGKSNYQASASPAAQPMAWSDIIHPDLAAQKAAYQVAHGAPVLAAGVLGGVAGGAVTAETGPGAAAGALGGGALSAGAMSAAQSIGPYYAAALKANPGDPQAAFSQALTKAGTDGVFSAAGWALFGFAPFQSAVKNLMLQAFAVQPAVAGAQKATENVEDGKPVGEGVADALPGAIVGTALPALGHQVLGAVRGTAAGDALPAGDAAPDVAAPDAVAPDANAVRPAEQGDAVAAPTAVGNRVTFDDNGTPASGTVVEGGKPGESQMIKVDGEEEPRPVGVNLIEPVAATKGDAATGAPAADDGDPFAHLIATQSFQPKQRDVLQLGDAAADPVTISPDVEKNAAAYLAGDAGANPVKVNLERIGSGEDIQATLEHVSSLLPAQAPIGHDSTRLLATSLNLSPEDFLGGYKGEQLDHVQTDAMRMMLDSSAGQLIQYAKAATDPATATPEAQALFLRAYGTHQGLQEYFENARAQAGRTLNAYGMMSRSRADYSKAISDLIQQNGGQADISTLASRIADFDDPAKASQFVAQSRQMSSRDLMLYGFYNVILSNVPHILAKKGLSDASMGLWNIATRYAAEKLGSGAVAQGETAALAYGYAASMQDAIGVAGHGIATGEHMSLGDYGGMDALGKNRITALADGAPPDITTDQPTRGAVEYLKMALPTRWIGAADDFAKYVNYRAELRALAFRDGTGKGLDGDALGVHIDQTMAVPPVQMHEQAVTATLRSTFQEPLSGLAARVQDVANEINIPVPGTDVKIPFGRMILPFVKIPANMAATVYRNSPLAAAFPSDQIKAELAAGGASRDLAVARMGLGSAAVLAAAGMAAGGLLTGRGPSDPSLNRAWRAAGNQPYSVTIGGTPYSYNQVDPVGMTLGAVADSFDIMRFAHDQSRGDIASSLMFGLGNAMLSKTYLSGLSNFFDALQQPEKEGSNYVDRFASSLLVPGAVAAVGTATDPWLRAHYDLLQSIEARTPMMREGLPPLRSLWGDPIPAKDGFMPPLSGTGLARAVSPVSYGQPADNAEPIDKWIWDNRSSFPHGDQGRIDLYKPGPVQSYEAPGARGVAAQVTLSPPQLDRLQVLGGNGTQDPSTGLGAKGMLNALVTGTVPGGLTGAQAAQVRQMQAQWDKLSTAAQAQRVLAVADKFRGAAKQQLLREDPDLANTVQTQWGARRQQLSPASGGAGAALSMPQIGG